MRQVVDLRTRIPVQLGSREAERDYEIERAEVRRAQRVQYAIAPRARLTLPNGTVRNAGEQVALGDFEGATFKVRDGEGRTKAVAKSAARALQDAIEDGIVLEADGFEGPLGPL